MAMGVLLSMLLAAHLDSCVGVALYAMRHPRFPCQAAMQIFHSVRPKCTSIVWDYFGHSNRCLKKWLRQPGKKTIIIHLGNKGAIRPFNAGEMGQGILRGRRPQKKALEREARAIISAIQPVLDRRTQVLLSPGLEDTYPDRSWPRLVKWFHEVSPYEVVRNSHDGDFAVGAFSELHDPAPCPDWPARDILSNDGWDTCELSGGFNGCLPIRQMHSAVRRQRERGIYLLWWGASQGLHGGRPPRLSPHPRSRRYILDPSTVRFLNAYLKEYNHAGNS